MSAKNRFAHIVEGEEIERFLEGYVSPAEGMPKNTDDVLKDVKEIWAGKGLLSPAELRAELAVKYLGPDAAPELVEMVRGIELSRNQPEHTTGYLSKEHAYLASSLAHLYAVEMDRPVGHMELDFSNMGGTNKLFREMLEREAAARGESVPDAVLQSRAEAMTDRVVLLISASITDVIQTYQPDAKVIPIRTGGDETRLHLDGVPPEQYEAITEMAHSLIEQHMARLGLQDHAHLKAPDDRLRDGFGAAIKTIDMRDIDDPANLIRDLDGYVADMKEDIGRLRRGEINEKVVAATIKAEIDAGERPVPAGKTPDEVVAEGVAAEKLKAQSVADMLHSINPDPRYDGLRGGQGIEFNSAVFHAYVDNAMAKMGATPIVSAPLPEVLGRDMTGGNRPEGVAPLASLEERRMAAAVQDLEGQGVSLTAAQRHILQGAVAGLTPVDPAAQTLMPKDMVKSMEIYAAEAEEYNKLHGLPEGARPQAFGVSVHGLAGYNKALGHHMADVGLRDLGNGIIAGAMADAGIPKGDIMLAHHGGANFTVLAKPGVTEAQIRQAEEGIAARMEELRGTKITEFLERRGIEVDEGLRASLKEKGLETFGDMQDSKVREITVNGRKVESGVEGVHATMVVRPIEANDNLNGNAFISGLRRESDMKMDALRNDLMVRAELSSPAVEAPRMGAGGIAASRFSGPGGGGGAAMPVVPVQHTGPSTMAVEKSSFLGGAGMKSAGEEKPKTPSSPPPPSQQSRPQVKAPGM